MKPEVLNEAWWLGGSLIPVRGPGYRLVGATSLVHSSPQIGIRLRLPVYTPIDFVNPLGLDEARFETVDLEVVAGRSGYYYYTRDGFEVLDRTRLLPLEGGVPQPSIILAIEAANKMKIWAGMEALLGRLAEHFGLPPEPVN